LAFLGFLTSFFGLLSLDMNFTTFIGIQAVAGSSFYKAEYIIPTKI